MSLLDALRFRLRVLLHDEEYARELGDEMEFHLAQDRAHQGVTPNEARRRFGNVTAYREETREMSGLGFLDRLRQDVRFALRTFRHAPAFTLVAVLTIALGIGATAAIFSVVHAVILEPLPYPDAGRIVMVWMDNRRLGVAEDYHSYPNLADLKAQNRVLSQLAPVLEGGVNLTGQGEPQRLVAGLLPAEAFAALGTRPVVGRLYDSTAEVNGADGVAVLSYGLWQSVFGGARDVIGREIQLNGRKRTVVAVMPPGFAFPSERTQLWVPLVIPEDLRNARQSFAFPAVGRLAPGVSLARARAEMSAIAKRLEEQYPSNRDYGVNLVPLPEQVVGPTLRAALWIMLGAVAAVLLIACANVANLLLSRAAVREREVTVRLALGASGRRLVRQFLTESVLLSLIGGAAGVALAVFGLRALRALAPADLPRIADAGVNGTVLLVTSVVTITTGILFGLVPALQSSRTTLSDSLREGGRGGSAGRGGQRLRRGIVAAQLAMVVVLLTGAGLLLRTFVGLQRVSLGFEPGNVFTMRVQLPGARYQQAEQRRRFFDGVLAQLRATPGVTDAGMVSTIMLSKTPNSAMTVIEGRERRPDDREVTFDVATPGFFRTIGAQLVAGRDFVVADRDGAPQVGIINEQMAKRFWPDASPIGRRFSFGSPDSDTSNAWITVVGVVADMRRTGVDMPVREEAFVPYAQVSGSAMMVVARTTGDPLALAPRARAIVRAIDRDQPISEMGTLEQQLERLVAQRRFSLTLVGAFAVLALVLAVVGAYGVTSYLVSQRTKEIGVRLALGAEPGRVARQIVMGGMRVASLGVALGVVGALLTTRLAGSLLYGVSPRDPVTIGGVAVLMLAVVALANWVPARRAARVDPLVALREE